MPSTSLDFVWDLMLRGPVSYWCPDTAKYKPMHIILLSTCLILEQYKSRLLFSSSLIQVLYGTNVQCLYCNFSMGLLFCRDNDGFTILIVMLDLMNLNVLCLKF